MTRPSEVTARLAHCDVRIAELAPGLRSDDLEEVERTWRAINAWLDNRIDAMGEVDPCIQQAQLSRSS